MKTLPRPTKHQVVDPGPFVFLHTIKCLRPKKPPKTEEGNQNYVKIDPGDVQEVGDTVNAIVNPVNI